jgi:lipopolysaccharide biosynthesis glycosyltransferase
MKHIPVYLICEDNYSPYMATMIASVCSHTQSWIDFHVFGKGILPGNREKIERMRKDFPRFSIDYHTWDLSRLYKIPYLSLPRMTPSTYVRMVFPELYPETEKALIMDVDIIALGDIEELWEQPLDGCPFAAALDEESEPRVAYQAFKKNLEVDTDCNYANCGVLLLDCRKWRAGGYSEKCLEVERKYREKLECADQDVINKVFQGHFKVLDRRYNSLLGDGTDIVIRHFCWLRKPWLSRYDAVGERIRHFEDWWRFTGMTPFFPELKQRFDALAARGDNTTPVRTRETYEKMEKITRYRSLMKINKSNHD